MNHTYAIERLSLGQVRTLYVERMPGDFPPDEIKPLFVIERAMAEGRYMCYGCFDGGDVLAYAFFAVHNGVALADYFAVARERRGRGVGSRFMQGLIAEPLRALSLVLLETEDPARARDADDLATRNRRLRFYLKNGLVDTGVRATVWRVPYIVLALPLGTPPAPEAARRAYMALYRAALPERIYEAKVVINAVSGT